MHLVFRITGFGDAQVEAEDGRIARIDDHVDLAAFGSVFGWSCNTDRLSAFIPDAWDGAKAVDITGVFDSVWACQQISSDIEDPELPPLPRARVPAARQGKDADRLVAKGRSA